MSTQKYQSVSNSPGSASMKEQEGVNEIPRDHQEGSDDDVPLPHQGFAVIGQQGGSDEEGLSSDEEGEGHMQNGGYQLLAQEPEGPEDSDEETESPPPTGSAASAYNPEVMQQVASSSEASSANSHLPQHLANLMPAQIPQPDQTTRVSYSDSGDVRERRKQPMAGDDQIKAAMSGFKLPTSAMPQWANFVSEEDWKKNLGSKLSEKQDTRQLGSEGREGGSGEGGNTDLQDNGAER